MIHILLLVICIASVEVFIRLNFLPLLDSILQVTKKVTHVISQNNISDHWKEKAIPSYALRIIKHSLKILLILILIIFLFLTAEFAVNDFLALTLSLIGIVESIIFAFGYIYLRKLFIK